MTAPLRKIFLDTETTGLDPKEGHRVIEIGCVEMHSRQLTGRRLHYYLNPERDIDAGAMAVHGIGLDFLADKPRFAEIAAEFLDFIREAELVIHNAPFDVAFLNAELARLDLPPLGASCGGVCDTLKMARERFPGKKNSLDALCERFSIDNAARTLHGALLDAELLADVYRAMTRGQDSLVMEDSAAGATIERPEAALKIVPASPAEIAAHEQTLAEIDGASKGKCLWLAAAPPAQASLPQ